MEIQRQRTVPIKPIIFIVLVLACTVVAFLPPVRDRISLEAINAQLAAITEIANRPYGPLLYLLVSVMIVLLQVPGLIVVVLAGLVYGLWEGFAYSLLASSIGLSATFLIARYFLRDYFYPKLSASFVGRRLEWLEGNGLLAMIVLRLIFIMAPPMNWMLGATNIRVRDYVIGTVVGLAPVVFLVMLIVRKLKTVTSMSDLWRPEVIAVIAGFAVIMVIILFLRKKLRVTQ